MIKIFNFDGRDISFIVSFAKTFILFFFAVVLIATTYYVWPEGKLPNNIKVEKIVVNKSRRTLELWANGRIIKVYPVSLGSDPIGHKHHEGDGRTPEGSYIINDKNPNSQFHLNLGISYPNQKDRLSSQNPGGDIKIHGLKNGLGFIGRFHRFFDWTNGCIAVTNQEIEELFDVVPVGTPIQINK